MGNVKLLGYFTGHLYDADSITEECCAILCESDARSVAKQNRIYEQQHKYCKNCFGCPKSKLSK